MLFDFSQKNMTFSEKFSFHQLHEQYQENSIEFLGKGANWSTKKPSE